MKETKQDNVIHVRIGKKNPKDLERFAKDVYGFDSISEFVRHAIDYVEEKRPTLGKAFAPEGANN